MTLMPDFQRDLESASARWRRPLPRALRAGRRLAGPLLVTGAIIAAAAAVAAWPEPTEREAESSAAATNPEIGRSGRAETSPGRDGVLARLLGNDATVGPVPEGLRASLTDGQTDRLAVEAAYAVAAAPGDGIPAPGAAAATVDEDWYVIEGDGEYCAILGQTTICDSTTDAADGLRRGRISVFATGGSGPSQLVGIVEDGVRTVQIKGADGATEAQASVKANAYRLELPDRFNEADGPTPHPVFVYAGGSANAD